MKCTRENLRLYFICLTCRCVSNRADLGISFALLNIGYSLYFIQYWLLELGNDLADYPVKWLMLYSFNIMINIYTILRMIKRETLPVVLWMLWTFFVVLFRFYFIYLNQDDEKEDKLDDLYIIPNLLVNVYILGTLVGMIYIINGLHLEKARQTPKEFLKNDFVYNPEGAAATAEEAAMVGRVEIDVMGNQGNIPPPPFYVEKEETEGNHIIEITFED